MRYHQIFLLSALAAFPQGSLTSRPPWDDMHTKHSWTTSPSNWKSLGCPPASTTIDLHISLKPHRENALIDILHEVSDPMHRKYGSYLTKEQVAELVAPHPDTLKLVYSWLEHHSVPSSSVSVTHGGSSLMLAGVPVSQANKILSASYQLYNHAETNETILRTINYSLPAALHAYVQTVTPTTCFASPRTQWHSSRAAVRPENLTSGKPVSMVLPNRDENGSSGSSVTLAFLNWIYNTWGYKPTAALWNDLGIVGFAGEYPNPTDLGTFMNTYGRHGTDATFNVVRVSDGGYDPSNPHPEPNLDIQYAEGIAYPTPLTFYSTGTGLSGKDEPFAGWLKYILNEPVIPPTISMSYGNEEQEYPYDHAIYVCFLFAQLAARGVSVLLASGDYGVGKGDCGAKGGPSNVRFATLFPATCPYVTSVGGTTGRDPEIAASLSGGGFSSYFERPPYQKQAVSEYLQQLGNLYQGLYDPGGRGTPDISAQAMKFPMILNGVERLESGTSASTPVVAAIISLLNDYRISNGKHTLGFLNPWLYRQALPGLNDVTSGSNPGCNTRGFPATTGWDPVTGLGTPDFEQLLLALPIT